MMSIINLGWYLMCGQIGYVATMVPSFSMEIAASMPHIPGSHLPHRPIASHFDAAHPIDSDTRVLGLLSRLVRTLPPRQREKVHAALVLTRMDRPVGALLLLWPTWWALWLASGGVPSWHVLVIFTMGVLVMRAAGCVINDFADRRLDGNVTRTAGRPIVSGRITPCAALGVFAGLLLLAFVLVLLTNRLTIYMAFVGAALATVYPFTKRWTHLPQVVLGAAFGWAIPMAFTAVTGQVSIAGWWLFGANVLWSVIYDTQYAMVDRDDDLKVGSKSTAILFGSWEVMILGALMVALCLVLLVVGRYADLAWPYYLALLACTGSFAYQHRLVRTRQASACFAAFHQNKWWGMMLWLGIALALILPHAG